MNSGDPWNPTQELKEKVLTMLKEAHRVLTPTGIFVSIAFGQVKTWLASVFLWTEDELLNACFKKNIASETRD